MTGGIAFTLMVLSAVLSYWQSGESGLLLAAPVLAVGAAATLRQMRQQAADLDGKIAAAQLAAQEVGTEIGQLRDAVQAREPDKRVMTDEERAKLTTLTARQKTQREILTSLLEEKQALTEDLAAAEAANEAARVAPDPSDAGPDAAASGHVSRWSIRRRGQAISAWSSSPSGQRRSRCRRDGRSHGAIRRS